MSFYVYILRCSDGSYYAGHTDNLEKRVAAHQEGAIAGYTSIRRPVQLVFAESFPSREEAFHRERQIKGWSRRKKAALIQGDWGLLQRLAHARGSTLCPSREGSGQAGSPQAEKVRRSP
ncbi:MAG: GIY-YIG nuclease family protein [Dehalococcoidia bacterium]|nr:GIY-YIG nuclease family protein [Dehalococcoidia bacterium]